MEPTIAHGCGCAHKAEKATEILSDEHRVIERVLGVLEQLTRLPVSDSLMRWQKALEFFRHFADECHHFKEEKVLFPAMEAHGIPNEGGPIGMMLAEHEEGRAHVRSMSAVVEQIAAGNAAFDSVASEPCPCLPHFVAGAYSEGRRHSFPDG